MIYEFYTDMMAYGSFVLSDLGRSPIGLWLVLFVLGAVLGSYALVVIDRLPFQQGWLDPEDHSVQPTSVNQQSCCEKCGTKLKFYQRVPVLSFLAMKGTAPCCGYKIPRRHLLVELSMGAIFAQVGQLAPNPVMGFSILFLLWCSYVLSTLDLRHHFLPSTITSTMLWVGLLVSPFEHDLFLRVVGGAVGAFLTWACMLMISMRRGEDTYAGGDIAVAAVIGAWFGAFLVAPLTLFASAVFVVQILLSGRHGEGHPFGPALLFTLLSAAVIAVWFPEYLAATKAWLGA
jgi:prepilin signal peptidase PulO-like enzyme (type II secretory pathway)